jgi:HEAT repeat protein
MLRSVPGPLDRLYDARRRALEAEAAVLDVEDEAELVPMLAAALAEARAQSSRTEQSFRMQVIADLAARVRDAGAVRLLVEILDDTDESVRARAALALARVATDRYPELVRAVEDALDEGLEGPALLELPGLFLDLADDEAPPPVDVLVRLVDHEDADVAAEAACALAELGGPGVVELLESFRGDERKLSDAVDGPATLGELIDQLIATLGLEQALDEPLA